MKNKINASLLFCLLAITIYGQSAGLPIFQVPVQQFSTSENIATSALTGQFLHDSGLVEIVDLNQSNLIAGDNVIEFDNEFFNSRISIGLVKFKNLMFKIDEGLLQSLDYETQKIDTLFQVENYKDVYRFSITEDHVALYYLNTKNDLKNKVSFYSLDGKFIKTIFLKKSEILLKINKNYLYVQNHDDNELRRISIQTEQDDILEISQKSKVLFATINDDLAIFIDTKKLFLLDFRTANLTLIPAQGIEKAVVSTLCITHWRNEEYVLNYGNNLFIFNLQKAVLTHEIKNQSNQSAVNNASVRDLLIDSNHFLYCRTVRNGIFKCDLKNEYFRINNAPLDQQFAKDVVVNEKVGIVLYANWLSNVVIHDLAGNLKHIISLGVDRLLIGIYQIDEDSYLLPFNNTTEQLILHVKDDYTYRLEKITASPIPLSSFYSKELLNDENEILIQGQSQLISYSKKDKTIETIKIVKSNFLPVTSIRISNKIYIQDYDALLVYDLEKQKTVGTINLGFQCLVRDMLVKEENKLLVAHNEGLFELDLLTSAVEHIPAVTEPIYTMEYFNDLLYLGTNNGILVIDDYKTINRIATNDDLNKSEFNTNAKLKTKEALYFGSNSGIIKLSKSNYGRALEYSIIPSRVKINNANEIYFFNQDQLDKTIILEPGEQDLEIVFSNLSPILHSQLSYQYSIDKKQWIDLGNNNTLNLNLSPGKYKVYYAGSRFFDSEATAGPYLSIRIKAKWYQSLLFKGLVLSSIIVGGFLIYLTLLKFKNEQVLSKLKLEKKVEQDKNRMAMDLHDNIGVNLSLLKRNIDFITENKNALSSEVVDEKLFFLSGVAGDLNTSLRDSIWATKREKLTLKEMIERVEKLVSSLEIDADKQVIHLENKLIDYSGEFAPSRVLGLYRVIQEAVHNAIKHSEASEIKIYFEHDGTKIKCVVSDTGKGFDQTQVEQSGLANMSKRAKNEGFAFDLESKEEEGTTITISIENGK